MSRTYKELLLTAKRQIKELSVDEVFNRFQNGYRFIFLDVREPDEKEKAYIDGSIFLPRGMLELFIEKIVRNKHSEIVIYCDVGNRSVLAAQTLKLMGYEKVFSMSGGIKSWMKKGFPVLTME